MHPTIYSPLLPGQKWLEPHELPVPETGFYVTHGVCVREESVANEAGPPARVFLLQDARIVSDRILDKDELSKLGLVQTHRWGCQASENQSWRCIEEFLTSDN